MIKPTSIGGQNLLDDFGGSPIVLAEAFLMGELKPNDECYAVESICPIVLEAARIRLEAMGKFNSLSRRLKQLKQLEKCKDLKLC